MKDVGSVNFIRIDGEVINPNMGSRKLNHQEAAIIIYKGRMRIEKWDGTDDWENNLKGSEVMVSGPMLILNGKIELIDSSAFNLTRHPRTAVALTKKNRILLITVDGRQTHRIAQLSSALSAITANLIQIYD